MIGNSSISVCDLYKAFSRFIKGKRKTKKIQQFIYNLERELSVLAKEIDERTYHHQPYEYFEVNDNKRRKVSVASIRDRVVHRLLYDRLVNIYDKGFLYDVWSCRKNKGLLGAINRTQYFLARYPRGFVWRMDITKFFESVDRNILKTLTLREVKDSETSYLIERVIESYGINEERERGMPIGNLTSQIFANIYLHEFDLYIAHVIRPLGFVRYGDDCIMVFSSKKEAESAQTEGVDFIKDRLCLDVHKRNNIIIPTYLGVHFLGCHIFPWGRRLNGRMKARIPEKLSLRNASSYISIVSQHENIKRKKELLWRIVELL